MNVQPYLFGHGWIEVIDGNDTARDIFERHYSAEKSIARRRQRGTKLFIGPGFKLLFVTADGAALCAWRKEKHRADGQTGVECCIFRREAQSPSSASVLLAGARIRAQFRWPGERLFSFVDPTKVTPTMIKGPRGHLYPVWGYCFYQDDWVFEGLTKKGLHILARYPAPLPHPLDRPEGW